MQVTAAAVELARVAVPGVEGPRPAELALPRGDGPFPAVVVIHEAYGLNDNIRDVTRRFALEGYAALAVDIFGGRNRAVCMARFLASSARGILDHFGVRDLQAALTHLQGLPEVDAGRVGAIGFCMGGGFAISWACSDDRLAAIAPFYGMNPRPLEAVRRSCPVVGSYPGKDFTAKAGRRLDVALTEAAVPHDIKIYDGARHSFFNDRGRSYDPGASEDAWRRTLAFFDQHIRRTST